MNTNNCCVVEFSHSQQHFHCDFLNVSIKRNIQSVKNNEPNDWVTIGVFETWEKAHEFIEEFEKQLKSFRK